MSQAVILLWVSMTTGQAATDVGSLPTSTARPASLAESHPIPSQRAAIRTWAESHLLRVEPPRRESRGTYPRYDSSVVQQIEGLLEQARVSAGSLDEALALEQLQQAEQLIYAHAELPQAGFLLAEAATQQAGLAERQGQARLAQIHRLRASALEGERARPYAAATEVDASPTDWTPAAIGSEKHIELTGLSAGDSVTWDGVARSSHAFPTVVGEHHLQIRRDGELTWAGFVFVHQTSGDVPVPVALPAACTRADLSGVDTHDRQLVQIGPVRCPLWAIARPATQGGVDIALCRHARCGSWLNWQQGFARPLVAPLHDAHPWQMPRWAAYVAAGAGAAAAAGLLLWQSGAFDDPESGPTTWTFGGVEE